MGNLNVDVVKGTCHRIFGICYDSSRMMAHTWCKPGVPKKKKKHAVSKQNAKPLHAHGNQAKTMHTMPHLAATNSNKTL